MPSIPRLAAYAAAFEESFASEDWSLVEPFFTEDAACVGDVGPRLGGRFASYLRAYGGRLGSSGE